MAEENDEQPNDPFIVLLKGLYQPVGVGEGPANNLGLSAVNLSDGSYSRTRIYPIFGISEDTDEDRSIGHFFVSLTKNLCAYQLPGGAIAMQFTGASQTIFPDGSGGQTRGNRDLFSFPGWS